MNELPPESARLKARLDARLTALDRFDRHGTERNYKIALLMLAILEFVFLWGFVQLADFSNRVHVLIFWSVLSTYTPMVIGLVILWGHVSRSTRLVLKALDLATRKEPGETPRASVPLGAEPDPQSRLWL